MKQRLVGAIVLVALAVIFLPMLLDGSGRSGPRDVAIDIPKRPQPPPNRLEQSDDPATDRAKAAPSGGSNSPAGAQSQPATMTEEPVAAEDRSDGDTATQQPSSASGESAPSGQTQDGADTGMAEESAAPSQPAPTEEDAATDSSASSEPAAEDSSGSSADAGADSWVVQVGSFSRETNALVLRDRLRELGFDTFVERADTDQGTVWRVRIGPVASEKEANRLSEQVTNERGGPALVMKHP